MPQATGQDLCKFGDMGKIYEQQMVVVVHCSSTQGLDNHEYSQLFSMSCCYY